HRSSSQSLLMPLHHKTAASSALFKRILLRSFSPRNYLLPFAILMGTHTLAGAQLASISETLYFPDAATESARRQQLHAQVSDLVAACKNATEPKLLAELERVESMIVALQRHAAYTRLQTLNNVDDKQMSAANSMVRSDITMLRAAVDSRLQSVSQKGAASLGRFAALAAEVLGEAKDQGLHPLTAETERYSGKVTRAFQQSVARTYAARIEQLNAVNSNLTGIKPTGELVKSEPSNNALTGASMLAAHRARMATIATAYDAAAPAIASLLGSQIDILNRDAVERGYPNAAEQKYAELGTTSNELGKTLASFAAEAPAYRRYQQLLKSHAQKKLGMQEIRASDVRLSSTASPPLSLDQARPLILGALEPLGTDFQQRMQRLLDPANGRLGLSGGSHRSEAPGTVIAVYDAPLAVYMGGFDGSLKRVATLAHEGGHAIHREIMNESGLATYQRNGPAYMFEAHGILSDLLLMNYVAEHANNPRQKIAALESFLEKIALEVFGSAQETAFEKSLYEAKLGNTMLQSKDVVQLYQNAITPYEIWPMSEVGNAQAWMDKTHVFDDPLYYTNYLYSGLTSFTLFSKIKSEPEFAKRYQALLRRGFDAPTKVLLASVGIDLNDPGLLKNAIKIFADKTEELRQLYIEVGELDVGSN
ncbi:MAG: hypothetical protein K2P84_14470, partial [Undibacterium sp.]|nr:hypothetical protein [Undibacterium sp.]